MRTHRRAGPGKQEGFTLIEIIVSLSITAVLLVIVLSALTLGIRSWEKGASGVEKAFLRRALEARLSREAGSIYPYRQKDEGLLFSGKENSLGFVTTAMISNDLPWGGAKWVCYSSGKNGVTIREKTVPSKDVRQDKGGGLIELGPEVKELHFKYLGPDGWEADWDANEKNALPEAVSVWISFRDKKWDMPLIIPVNTKMPG